MQYIDQHCPCTDAVWAFFWRQSRRSVSIFSAKVGAKHDILQNLFTYFLLINFVSVCPWIRKTKCTDQPALNFLRELSFLKWKYVMFNLCYGTFRIEGSGGLRKPLQLGCDCQLLKAFVCRVFCCFKGYTLKSPADHTARSPRKPKYIYCKHPHISVISHINLVWGYSGVILVRVCEPINLKPTSIIYLAFEKKKNSPFLYLIS